MTFFENNTAKTTPICNISQLHSTPKQWQAVLFLMWTLTCLCLHLQTHQKHRIISKCTHSHHGRCDPSCHPAVSEQKRLWLRCHQETLSISNNQCFKNRPFFAVLFARFTWTEQRDKRQTNVTGHEPPLLSNEIKWQFLSEKGMLREMESKGERSRGILSSQEIEAITSKLSSGPFGGQEQTNQFGPLLSACQPHRRTPWHPIIGAK